ncbi:hypothetical protein SUGI_0033460 [Cryptomeria japonica]|nr:hypothetical protein SUGI_0033460 [Cryptomeria japonica]
MQDLTLLESLEKKSPTWQEPLLYTAKSYGSVKRIYVVAKDDKCLVEAFQNNMSVKVKQSRIKAMEMDFS